MPAATTKADLLAVTAHEFSRLIRVLDGVPGGAALAKDDADTSIKDVVAHRAHWIGLFLGWWQEGQAGGQPRMPAPGYTWGDLKRFNADLRAAQAGLGWDAARADLAAAHADLVAFVEGRSEEELYGGPMRGGRNAWTTGRWAEAAGASHYRSAAKYVRARLREIRDAGAD